MYICILTLPLFSLKGDNEVQEAVDSQSKATEVRASPSETTVVSTTSSYALRATVNAFNCNKAIQEAMRESQPSPYIAEAKTQTEMAKAEIAERKESKSAGIALKKESKDFQAMQRKKSTVYSKMWKKASDIHQKDQKRLNSMLEKRLRHEAKLRKLELLDTKLENKLCAIEHGFVVESKEPKRGIRIRRKRNPSNIVFKFIGIS